MVRLLKKLYQAINGPSLVVYVACKMTGRDKLEMVDRAKYVCSVLKAKGITPISPVLEEEVKAETGKLVNHDEEKMRTFWARDKQIIRYVAHAVLLDQAEMK